MTRTNNLKATIVFKKNWDAINATNEDGRRRYKYIINTGSSRSSKTISIIDLIDLYARSNKDKRCTVWRDTKKDCKDTVLHDAQKHFKRTNRVTKFNKTESVFFYPTGSTFEIHGTDDEEKVHGLEQDIAWLNEPYKISKDTFDQLDQRTTDFIIIDWNPKKAHWIEDVAKSERAIVINSTFRDNPFCPDEQRRKMLSYQSVKYSTIVADGLITEQEARDYDLVANIRDFTSRQINNLTRCRNNEDRGTANEFNWQVYGLGLKAERPNRIFRWTEIPTILYREIDAQKYVGCDWGTVDPWGLVEAKYYDGGLYLHELNYRSENEVRNVMTATERTQMSGEDEGIVSWLFRKAGVSEDTPVICDTNRPLKIAALRRSGYNAHPALKAANSIIDGIDILNNLKVYYTSSSVNLKYEQENYSRKTDRYGNVLEEPEDLDNHLIDPARYICFYLLQLGIISKL